MNKILVVLSCLLTCSSFSVQSFALDGTNVTSMVPSMPVTQQSIAALPADVKARLKEAVKGGNGGALSQLASGPVEDAAVADPQRAAEDDELQGLAVLEQKYSKIEQQYRLGYGSLLSNDLHQFGYELFQASVGRISRLAIPDDDYLLGPGDKLRIRIWGAQVDAEFIGAVGRNGSINVPKIGIVPVAGVRFGAVESVIRKEAEKYVQGININVSLEELRSVEVYVVGAVNAPGLHMVPAFSTVLGGLLAGDGVKKTGSLRVIELYRDGRLFKKIDLYDLLLAGKRDFDVILADKDVVFVPRLGVTVAVAGAVSEEGIFELGDEKTVGDIFELAGGILPQGSIGRMHLRRYLQNQEFAVRDIATSAGNEAWKEIPVHDGDLLELQFLSPTWPKVVKLEGHVWMPDVFQFRQGLTLADILVSVDLLKPGAVTDFGMLYRYDATSTRFQVKRFPLAQVLAHEYDAELQPYDRLVILSREELGIKEEFNVHGAVWNEGTFTFRPGLTLADAVALAGGDKFGARLQGIELSRQEIEDDQVVTKQFLVDLEMDGAIMLQPFDDVFIPQIKDAALQEKVVISGQVKYPGSYVIKANEHISDVIQRAGGFLPGAYYYGAEYASEKARQIQQQSIDRLLQELEVRGQQAMVAEAQTAIDAEGSAAAKAAESSIAALLNKLKSVKAKGRVAVRLADLESFRGSKDDFLVENGDSLYIPKLPNFVATVGSVYSPSAYLYESDMNVGYYLDKSGGPTKLADEDYVYLLKANGEVVSKSRMKGLFHSFGSLKLMPGDTIVVPEDLERIPYLRLVRDVSDIVFKIATTAGVAIAVI